jgi:hypothetical protein
MSIVPKLAHSLGRRDEVPNQELARTIAAKNDKHAVQELVENLYNKTRGIQHDCIKVLYEIGLLNPFLISGYLPTFLLLLQSNNNRMQWGGMTAINSITFAEPAAVYKALPLVIAAADKGSVITRDHTVFILIKLCSLKKYGNDAFELLVDQLRNCPANQLPMYAERAMPIITEKNKAIFRTALRSRLKDMEAGNKKNRVEKVIKKMALAEG